MVENYQNKRNNDNLKSNNNNNKYQSNNNNNNNNDCRYNQNNNETYTNEDAEKIRMCFQNIPISKLCRIREENLVAEGKDEMIEKIKHSHHYHHHHHHHHHRNTNICLPQNQNVSRKQNGYGVVDQKKGDGASQMKKRHYHINDLKLDVSALDRRKSKHKEAISSRSFNGVQSIGGTMEGQSFLLIHSERIRRDCKSGDYQDQSSVEQRETKYKGSRFQHFPHPVIFCLKRSIWKKRYDNMKSVGMEQKGNPDTEIKNGTQRPGFHYFHEEHPEAVSHNAKNGNISLPFISKKPDHKEDILNMMHRKENMDYEDINQESGIGCGNPLVVQFMQKSNNTGLPLIPSGHTKSKRTTIAKISLY